MQKTTTYSNQHSIAVSSNSPAQTTSADSQNEKPKSFPLVGFSVTSTRSFRATPMSDPASKIKSICAAFLKETGLEDTSAVKNCKTPTSSVSPGGGFSQSKENVRTQEEIETKALRQVINQNEKIYSDANKAILSCAKLLETAETKLENHLRLNPAFAEQWKKIKAPLEKAQQLMKHFDEIRRQMTETLSESKWEDLKQKGENTWKQIACCMLVPNPKNGLERIFYQDYLSDWLKNLELNTTF